LQAAVGQPLLVEVPPQRQGGPPGCMIANSIPARLVATRMRVV
jgi:hypothetical protein